MQDRVYRAWGILQHARHLEMPDFFALWSAVRSGLSMGLLAGDLEALSQLLSTLLQEQAAAQADNELYQAVQRAATARRAMSGITAVEGKTIGPEEYLA